MEGGDRTIDTQLQFSAYTSESQALGQIIVRATFYEAAIQVDAILAYPWMRENEIGVFPYKKSICHVYPRFNFALRSRKSRPILPQDGGGGRALH